MIETIIILTFGILSLLCLNLYGSVHIPETYAQKMRSLGNGIRLGWKDNNTGEVSEKKFVLSEMKSREMKALEKELTSIGSKYESKQVHEYRTFRVQNSMMRNRDQKQRRARMKDIASRNGLDFAELPLKNLDAFILETFGRPINYD